MVWSAIVVVVQRQPTKGNGMCNYAIIDTETCPMVRTRDNSVNPDNMLVYDIGWVIQDKKGNVQVARSYIVADVFYGRSDCMNSAYYANKLPQYHKGAGSAWIVDNFLNIRKQFLNDCKEYKVQSVWAYNALFDKRALNNTIKVLSNGFSTYFMPYGMKVKDIWRYAMECGLTCSKKYVKWAYDHGYISSKGNPYTTAETVYRYLMGDHGFIESHTALEDAKIEGDILTAILKRKKKQPSKMGDGWRGASKVAKEMGY